MRCQAADFATSAKTGVTGGNSPGGFRLGSRCALAESMCFGVHCPVNQGRQRSWRPIPLRIRYERTASAHQKPQLAQLDASRNAS